jgi:hypothetical protein
MGIPEEMELVINGFKVRRVELHRFASGKIKAIQT